MSWPDWLLRKLLNNGPDDQQVRNWFCAWIVRKHYHLLTVMGQRALLQCCECRVRKKNIKSDYGKNNAWYEPNVLSENNKSQICPTLHSNFLLQFWCFIFFLSDFLSIFKCESLHGFSTNHRLDFLMWLSLSGIFLFCFIVSDLRRDVHKLRIVSLNDYCAMLKTNACSLVPEQEKKSPEKEDL